METTLLQTILLLTMQAIEQKYGREVSGAALRPLAESFDALKKLELMHQELRNSKGGGV